MKLKLGLMIALLLLAGVAVSRVMQHHADKQPVTVVQHDELQLGSLKFHACEIGKHTGRGTVAAYCTQYAVPENRADPAGRHINLKVAIIKTEAATPDADMVAFLDGGRVDQPSMTIPVSAMHLPDYSAASHSIDGSAWHRWFQCA